METVRELLPLVQEVMAQKPRGQLARLYVLGSVLALLGAVLGLVQTLCGPFAAASRLRAERAAVAELRDARQRQALLGKGKTPAALGGRALSVRQHAS